MKRTSTKELRELIANAYMVIEVLSEECGRFNDPQVTKMLDNLSLGRMVHKDVLPFPSKPPKNQ